MIINIGVDIVEIDRICRILNRNKNFLKFILGETELSQLKIRNFPVASIAANFSGKEAFLKTFGWSINSIDFRDVQIIRCFQGKPEFLFSGKIKEIIKKNDFNFFISLTHSNNIACAVVVCEKRT
ncbi:MAG: holo-ACP synthase [Candidatus Improbicoccus devescovinae]|nr:MAG: holo-ACP synthase [Candidatus Improbicoccus devescovinae]